MTTNNMGTPMHPEGLPHWTLKNFLARNLRDRLANDSPYLVGHFDCCENGCQLAPPVPVFENLLGGITSVDVEGTVSNRRPDIVLLKEDMPTRVIEIVVTSQMTPEKLDDYRNAGAEVFVFYTDRESAWAKVSTPAQWVEAPVLNGCRKRKRERLRGLMESLESTLDSTFGVEQPELKVESPKELDGQMNGIQRRRVSSTIYIGDDYHISRDDYSPSYQKFVVAGRTVSKEDLFGVIGHVKWIADINGLAGRVGPILWEILLKIRHANGGARRVGESVKPMVEYPLEDATEFATTRNPWGSSLLYYERQFHTERAITRFRT